MSTQHKIGFWSVFALVTGSQIGSGVFMLPAALAPYGLMSLLGWIISGIGAIALALVFAGLCCRFPRTGGPHVYVMQSFGHTAGFFTGWTYWVISWVSTTAVVVASIGYLTPLIGNHGAEVNLVLQIGLLAIITGLNLKGVDAAGHAEFVLTVLKIIPLIVLPAAALYYFDVKNFVMTPEVQALPTSKILAQVTLFTLWGFIGLELGTTPAGSVENPGKTIPRAIVFGTLTVAILYLFNSIGIMGLIPGSDLVTAKAPYVDMAQRLFGGHWYLAISIIASIICIGTLNAWVLSTGQIALGLAEDRLMPPVFAHRNTNDAPFWGIITSCFGIVPLLILTADESISKQISTIVDISVTAFLFVYLSCCLAFIRLLWTREVAPCASRIFYAAVATGFCAWVIYETPPSTLAVALIFTLSGIPGYFLWIRKRLSVSANNPT
jgi:basic amino acid/polyamine antiporter, APA family